MRDTQIKKDLRSLAGLLSSWGKNVRNSNVLNNMVVYKEANNLVGYSLDKATPLIFTNIDLDRHSIPSGIENIHDDYKTFDIHLNILFKENNGELDDSDPIENLGVSIRIEGDFIKDDKEGKAMCSWHLDRDGAAKSVYCHPIYHMNFGGEHMTAQAIKSNGYFGNLLLLPNPRIIHPPMDIVLSCDFILRNFYKKATHQSITSLPGYKILVKQAVDRYWTSYFFAFASNWKEDMKISNLTFEKLIGN
jgi:hypothetical protein